jgi:hypothetical protein
MDPLQLGLDALEFERGLHDPDRGSPEVGKDRAEAIAAPAVGDPPPGVRRLLEPALREGAVAAGRRDQSLHAGEPGDEGVGKVGRAHRLKGRGADLGVGLVAAPERGERLGAGKPRERPAERPHALEGAREQSDRTLVLAAREGDHAAVGGGESGVLGTPEPIGQLLGALGGGERVVEPAYAQVEVGAGRPAQQLEAEGADALQRRQRAITPRRGRARPPPWPPRRR